MILPSKHILQERALLSVGARMLKLLSQPRTISALWEEFNRHDEGTSSTDSQRISYDWFLLALDLLYAIGTIEFSSGLVTRKTS